MAEAAEDGAEEGTEEGSDEGAAETTVGIGEGEGVVPWPPRLSEADGEGLLALSAPFPEGELGDCSFERLTPYLESQPVPRAIRVPIAREKPTKRLDFKKHFMTPDISFRMPSKVFFRHFDGFLDNK